MASKAIIDLKDTKELNIGTWIDNKIQKHQVQLELNNGRRFILTGLRVPEREFCESAIEIIKSDNCVNLAEFTETTPVENSLAYKTMEAKGFLKQFF